jgi:hypothetical protein
MLFMTHLVYLREISHPVAAPRLNAMPKVKPMNLSGSFLTHAVAFPAKASAVRHPLRTALRAAFTSL